MRAPRRAPSGKSERPRRFAWLAPLMRRPGRTIACATCAALLTGIGANALFCQTARHPAPIFGAPVSPRAKIASTQPAAPRTEAAPPGAVVPVPPPRPADFSAAAPPRIAVEPPKDQIGSLLKASSVTSPDMVRTTQAAQRALIALGHPLKADGVMGASTRQAIEKFEASRKLPVTGELTPRTLRELAAQTGVSVQ